MGVMTLDFTALVTTSYGSFLALLPLWVQQIINLLLIILLVVVYSFFVWKLYRFMGKKNLIELNLNKYNTTEHPFFSKVMAGFFYLLEYIIILPFLIFFWFAFFTIFLILLTKDLDISKIIIISATIIGAIRMISYWPRYGQDLAKEVAKVLPFTILAVSMTQSGFFDFQRILIQLNQLTGFFSEIIVYILFIIALEILLRVVDFFLSLFGLKEPDLEEEEGKS